MIKISFTLQLIGHEKLSATACTTFETEAVQQGVGIGYKQVLYLETEIFSRSWKSSETELLQSKQFTS